MFRHNNQEQPFETHSESKNMQFQAAVAAHSVFLVTRLNEWNEWNKNRNIKITIWTMKMSCNEQLSRDRNTKNIIKRSWRKMVNGRRQSIFTFLFCSSFHFYFFFRDILLGDDNRFYEHSLQLTEFSFGSASCVFTSLSIHKK